MTIEKMEFKTEVRQLLDLMIHSLYSHKEIFLRELISNASDAIDKARYESLTNSAIADQAGPWKIRISADKEAKTLTISDNGIGMTKDEIIEALGTIAHSGTREFFEALREKKVEDSPALIGQFGVGFYSSFMVSDRVKVISRRAGAEGTKAVRWESAADGSFTVDEADKASCGTDIILTIKDDEQKFLDTWEIRNIVRKYSDYIEYPVVMDVEREKESEIAKGEKVKIREEETLNSMKALWLKDKAEIKQEEYSEFYRHISHDFGDPAKVVHYRAEGTSEFTALLFIPSKAPMGIFFKDYKIGPSLYVKKVQIMDHCEDLLPPYLRFVRGVVDSSDLPLNISREMLQSNRQVEIIKKNIVKKVLDTLADMKRDEYEKYLAFYKEFGRILKEGLHYDFSRREQIADLLLFPSTKTGPDAFTTLRAYVDGMKPGQEEIYYITGTRFDEAAASPYLESFRKKDYEVLVMLDEIDDFIVGGLHEYSGKKIKSAIKGAVSLQDMGEMEKEAASKKYRKLLDLISQRLKDDIKDVRLSGRLTDSACCLVMDEGALDPNMERIMKAMGQEVPENKRIFELNPSHPVIVAMNEAVEHGDKEGMVGEHIDLLYNQALLLEGSKPKDPAAFAKAISSLMAANLKGTGS